MLRIKLLPFAAVIAMGLASVAYGQRSSTGSSGLTDASRAEAVRFLTELVKIDTSNPPGNEVKAAVFPGVVTCRR